MCICLILSHHKKVKLLLSSCHSMHHMYMFICYSFQNTIRQHMSAPLRHTKRMKVMEVELIIQQRKKSLKELSRQYEYLFVNNIYRFFVCHCALLSLLLCVMKFYLLWFWNLLWYEFFFLIGVGFLNEVLFDRRNWVVDVF